MHESSAATSPSFPQPISPDLHPVPQPVIEPLADRVISLGGPVEGKLGTFTISARLRNRSVLNDTDLARDEITEVLETAARLKKLRQNGKPHNYLPGKTLGMLFQHPSTRTRVSFEAGMAQLGGQAIFLGVNDLQMKRGETIADTAQVLSRYVDGIAARVSTHDELLQLSGAASIPVFNCLTDKSHPLQALADLLTLQERCGSLAGLKLAYLGDGNNMCHSLLLTSAAMGVNLAVAAPAAHQPDPEVVKHASWLASGSGATVTISDDPLAAARDADAIYTDVHVSMGQKDGPARAVALAPYKVTTAVMAVGRPNAIFMHRLPMHRDQEVAAEVADGPQSVIFDQAENRLHLHKAILLHSLCTPNRAH